MKKILNWSFGAFFRTLGRTFAFLFLGALFGLVCFKKGLKISDLFGIDMVSAATGSYSSSTYAIREIEHPYGTTGYNSFSNQTSFNNLGTGFTITDNSGSLNLGAYLRVGVVNLRTYTTDSNKWKSTNTYHFKYRFCQSLKNYTSDEWDVMEVGSRVGEFTYNTSNQATGSTSGDTNLVSWSIDRESSSQWCWSLTLDFSPVVDSRYVGFQFFFAPYKVGNTWNYNPSNKYQDGMYTGQNFRLDSLSITYEEGSKTDIENATQQIINNNNNNTNSIINNINEGANQINDSVNDINDNINNSNVDEAINNASDLFTNFENNTHGLTGIITAPLELIRSISSSSCSSLRIPLPFVDDYLILPCLSTIYRQYFPNLLSIYQIIISGVIGYQICISIFFLVKDFKDPDSDKIEVLDL